MTQIPSEDIIGAFTEVYKLAAKKCNKTQFIVMGLRGLDECKVKVLLCNERRNISTMFCNDLEQNPGCGEI